MELGVGAAEGKDGVQSLSLFGWECVLGGALTR